jgi:hypothetical protein
VSVSQLGSFQGVPKDVIIEILKYMDSFEELTSKRLVCKLFDLLHTQCISPFHISNLSQKISQANLSPGYRARLQQALHRKFQPLAHAISTFETKIQKLEEYNKDKNAHTILMNNLREIVNKAKESKEPKEDFPRQSVDELCIKITEKSNSWKSVSEELTRVNDHLKGYRSKLCLAPHDSILRLDEDWTARLKSLIDNEHFDLVARVLLFRPTFKQNDVAKMLLSAPQSAGKYFCLGLMIKLHYKLSDTDLSTKYELIKCILCSNDLKLHDFKISQVNFLNSNGVLHPKLELLTDTLMYVNIILGNEENKKKLLQLSPFFDHPELIPHRGLHRTHEEYKQILVDLFCELGFDSFTSKNTILKLANFSDEFKELISEAVEEYRKKTQVNNDNSSFIQKLLSVLPLYTQTT